MAGKAIHMRKAEDVVRLHKNGVSVRRISKILGIHRNTVKKYIEDGCPGSCIINNNFLHESTDSILSSNTPDDNWTSRINWEEIRAQVLSGVSIEVIHEELRKEDLVPVQYSGFWKQLSKRVTLSKATMVKVHPPGIRCEIDYCDGISIYDPRTGEFQKTELFVGVLCHSRYAFAEFTLSQSSEDFLSSHVRMLQFFGGVPQVITPDNLKSAVSRAHRYDPVINQAYTRLSAHYGFTVEPARVKRPQDKAVVERTIQSFQKWFYMRVRHRKFTSLVELNIALKEALEIFNKKVHRTFKKTRQEMFQNEKPSLMPSPIKEYVVSSHKQAVLGRDCHLSFEKNFYSAPHELRGQTLDLWYTAKTIEIYNSKLELVALHPRRKGEGHFSTNKNHYPLSHQAFLEEDISSALSWAKRVGPETEKLIQSLLQGEFPLRYLRRAQGILGLSKSYGAMALESASKKANMFNNLNIHFIKRVLDCGGLENRKGGESIIRGENENLRGINQVLH